MTIVYSGGEAIVNSDRSASATESSIYQDYAVQGNSTTTTPLVYNPVQDMGSDAIDGSAQSGYRPSLPGAMSGSPFANTEGPSTPEAGNKSGIANGAEKRVTSSAVATWDNDLRVRIVVPPMYLESEITRGPAGILEKQGGILFPYTTNIQFGESVNYHTKNPIHSNFSQHFFKYSAVDDLKVEGIFTVQNEYDGAVFLSIIHLLRGLTKMRAGTDPVPGSPPPICRFYGYGGSVFRNVPVVIANWSTTFSEKDDYVQVGRKSKVYDGKNFVPVYNKIVLNLKVIYSRAEVLNYNVTDWLSGKLRGKGYL